MAVDEQGKTQRKAPGGASVMRRVVDLEGRVRALEQLVGPVTPEVQHGADETLELFPSEER